MRAYQMTPTQAVCPVCRSQSAHVLWAVNCEQAAQHFVLKEVERERFQKLASHIQSLWKRTDCEVLRCDQCEFCFSHPYVAGDAQFYALAYQRTHYPGWKWEYQRSYEVIRNEGRTGDHLLEIGAGDGAFIKRIAPDIIPKQNALCTEFSDYGRRKIEEYGVVCLPNDVRNLSEENLKGRFHIICMFQVLEHMDQLDALFQKLNWLMNDGASLLISVPNPEEIQLNELHGSLLDMPPNHIGRWNRRCFEVIGQRWGFDVHSHEIEKTSWASKARQFCVFRFMRKSQQANSLANRILRIRQRHVRRLMMIGGMGVYALTSAPALNAFRAANAGITQWAHLKKTDNG